MQSLAVCFAVSLALAVVLCRGNDTKDNRVKQDKDKDGSGGCKFGNKDYALNRTIKDPKTCAGLRCTSQNWTVVKCGSTGTHEERLQQSDEEGFPKCCDKIQEGGKYGPGTSNRDPEQVAQHTDRLK